MKYLKTFCRQKKGMLTLTLFLLIGQVVGTLLIPFLISRIVDRGIIPGNMAAIYQTGIRMLAVSLITAVISILGCYYSAELSIAFGRNMRESIFRKSQAITLEQFDEIGVSSMLTRSTSDITNIQQTLVMILQMIVPAPLIVAVCIGMTVRISPRLALIPIICILLFMIVAYIILKKSQPLSLQIQNRMDRINQVLREFISGVRVIRAFDNGAYEQKRSDDTFEEYASHMIKLNRLFAVMNPVVWLIMGGSIAAIAWFGGIFSAQGTMQIGQITAVVEYTIITLSYLIMAVMSVVTLPKMRACLQRLTEVLDTTPKITDKASDPVFDYNGPSVRFSHVTFSYPGAEEPVLKDLSFCCRPGETTAIIGSTGSGKSTIANLLLRLHEINEGSILLHGQDIRSLSQELLRNSIGYTPQKAVLFSGTIAKNLQMGRANASENDMIQALQTAQAYDFVQGLPLGLNAPVSQNGSNFSGGQKQRLAIARSLIKNVPVLIFDDSFSALDSRTDRALRKALKEQNSAAAKIIIAQRIQTILDADQIIVLDEGKIAGIGTHEALMKSCEVYNAIAKSQLSPEEVIPYE